MDIEPGSIAHFAQILSHVIAPAFLLGAVASFVSILITRMTTVLQRIRDLNELPPDGHAKSVLKSDIPRLRRRLALLNRALVLAIASGVAAAILIIGAFAAAILSMNHVWGAAIMFIVAMGLLCASLVVFGIEVTIGLSEFDER